MAIAGGRSAIAIPMILLCIGRPRFTFSRAQIGGAIGHVFPEAASGAGLTIVALVFAGLSGAMQTLPAYEYGRLAQRWVSAPEPITAP